MIEIKGTLTQNSIGTAGSNSEDTLTGLASMTHSVCQRISKGALPKKAKITARTKILFKKTSQTRFDLPQLDLVKTERFF